MSAAPGPISEPAAALDPSLPTLHRALLSPAQAQALAAALEALPRPVEVLVKAAAARHGESGGDVGPARAVALLLAGLLRGVQLRYWLDDQAYIDSLRPAEGGVLVVRMAAPAAPPEA